MRVGLFRYYLNALIVNAVRFLLLTLMKLIVCERIFSEYECCSSYENLWTTNLVVMECLVLSR
jgi:hypothetical protein